MDPATPYRTPTATGPIRLVPDQFRLVPKTSHRGPSGLVPPVPPPYGGTSPEPVQTTTRPNTPNTPPVPGTSHPEETHR